MPEWCFCLKSGGKLGFCAVPNIPFSPRETQGDCTCWRSLRYCLEFFSLWKMPSFIAGLVLGWRDGHFPLNPIQPGFDLLVFPNFSFSCHALSSACHRLGPSWENLKKKPNQRHSCEPHKHSGWEKSQNTTKYEFISITQAHTEPGLLGPRSKKSLS